MGDKYSVVNDLISRVKDEWACPEINEICKVYRPFILKVAERVFYDYGGSNEQNEIIQTSHSFFLQLIWEYDLSSPVNFNVYIKRKLYYRVKNYYKKDIDHRMITYDPELAFVKNKKEAEDSQWASICKNLSDVHLDVIVCIMCLGMKQVEIAAIFDVPQPYIYRVKDLAIKKIVRIYNQLSYEESYGSISS